MSTMMKELVKKEWASLCEVLKSKMDETYCPYRSILCGSWCNPYAIDTLPDEELGLGMCDEVIYTITENGNYRDETENTHYGSCKVDMMKPRWKYMADNEYVIKEVIEFELDNCMFVRLVLFQPYPYDSPPTDMSRIEFAFGKMTFGVSYILPWHVWEQHREEIETIFKDSVVILLKPSNMTYEDLWENMSILA